MIASIFLSVLLAQAAAVPPAGGQPAAKTAVAAQLQDSSGQPWPEGILRPGQGLTSPEVITEAKPKYTAEAMRARIEGVVEMEAIVRADGSVGPVRVVRSLDKEWGLDAQAVRAMKEWTFKPGMKDGAPVNVLVNVEMSFKLRDRR